MFRTSDTIREERERLASLLEAKAAALEEARASQEATAKKLKLREKRIRQLDEERVQVVPDIPICIAAQQELCRQ